MSGFDQPRASGLVRCWLTDLYQREFQTYNFATLVQRITALTGQFPVYFQHLDARLHLSAVNKRNRALDARYIIKRQSRGRGNRRLVDGFTAKDLSDPEFFVVAFALPEHPLQDDAALMTSWYPHENDCRRFHVPTPSIPVQDRSQLGQGKIGNRGRRIDDHGDI